MPLFGAGRVTEYLPCFLGDLSPPKIRGVFILCETRTSRTELAEFKYGSQIADFSPK